MSCTDSRRDLFQDLWPGWSELPDEGNACSCVLLSLTVAAHFILKECSEFQRFHWLTLSEANLSQMLPSNAVCDSMSVLNASITQWNHWTLNDLENRHQCKCHRGKQNHIQWINSIKCSSKCFLFPEHMRRKKKTNWKTFWRGTLSIPNVTPPLLNSNYMRDLIKFYYDQGEWVLRNLGQHIPNYHSVSIMIIWFYLFAYRKYEVVESTTL